MRAVDNNTRRPANAEPVDVESATAIDVEDRATTVDLDNPAPVDDDNAAPVDDDTPVAVGDDRAPVDDENPADVDDDNPAAIDDGTTDHEPEVREPKPAQAEPDPARDRTEASAGLWPEPEVQALRDRWHEVQLRFVDDPRAAADEAASIVDEARQALTAAIESRCNELGQWRSAGNQSADDTESAGDTEQLRMVVQRYRGILDRVLAV